MANYLKFDIYDLELTNIMRDSDLRKLLLRTANRSILVIEDIDCTVELPDRMGGFTGHGQYSQRDQLSLYTTNQNYPIDLEVIGSNLKLPYYFSDKKKKKITDKKKYKLVVRPVQLGFENNKLLVINNFG